MSRGTKLSRAVEMLKAEIGTSLDSSTNLTESTRLKWLIQNKQIILADQWDWPFMEVRADVNLSAGTKTYTVPTTVDFERPVKTDVQWNNFWRKIIYGVGTEEYNWYDSDAAETQDPVQRWRFSSETEFEVWPIPASDQTMRFTGIRPLTTLFSAGSTFNDNALLDLDDLLIVYFVAAEYLAGQKKAEASAKLAQAQERLRTLRANYPVRTRDVIICGDAVIDHYRELRRTVHVVSVA